MDTNHKAEFVIETWVQVVFHHLKMKSSMSSEEARAFYLCFQLVMGARHEKDPDIWVNLAWRNGFEFKILT